MNNEPIISAQQVRDIFHDCFYTPEEAAGLLEPPKDAILVEGVLGQIGFNPIRVEKHRETIRGFLNEMPKSFHKSNGGGMSFLNLCQDKHDRQWADAHESMNMLVCLGLATKMAKYLMGREYWSSLPGGMPYVVFDTSVAA